MATGYLLDTNILSAGLRGEPRPLLNRLAGLAPNRLHVPCIVLAELTAGAELGTRKASTLAALAEMTTGMTVLPFDADCATVYGRIRAALQRKGSLIGPMDMLIAAQALATGLVLVTANMREFRGVPGLQCENWMR
ncbi:MAG: PIN domain-containing protein [Rhodanobacter sp.]